MTLNSPLPTQRRKSHVSLNHSERCDTRAELEENLTLSGLATDDVAHALGWPADRVHTALQVAGAPPRDVWLVRDFLDRAVRAAGRTPRGWSSLTEQMRSAADTWFGLLDLDEVLHVARR